MKFLCPSCKAKYQIADEKVAGRSVRMKCRKCGHMIQISKAVTEGSVERKPVEPAAATPGPQSPSARTPGPAPSAPRPAPQSPATPHAPPPRPRASAPLAAPPPRRAASRGLDQAGPLAAEPVGPTPSPGGAAPTGEPRVSNVHARGNGGSNGSAAALGLVRYDEDDERTVIAGAGALAGAFAQAVQAPDSSALPDLIGSEEWYVGINGVPVGPIRLSELRSKAAAGAITEDSLVWRDGFEEWMPLKTFPELVAIVDEGVSSARASLTPLSPNVSSSPAAQFTPMQDPFAAPAPTASVGEIGDPFAAAAVPTASAPATGPAVVTEKDGLGDVDLEALVPKRRGSFAPWIAVVVALMFGLTIGFVVFSRQKPAKQIIKYVQVPAKGSDKSADKSADKKTDDTNQPDQQETASNKTAKGGTHAGGHAGSSTKTKEKGGGLTGLSGLAGLQGGPHVGPSGGSSSASSGQPLDSSAVQRTVSRYTGSVKRSCWQPALDTREKDAPASARVAVTINVAPSGAVQGVSTTGDPHGYHGLASCIGSRVRGWRFPASSGSTTVKVPFVFASQ